MKVGPTEDGTGRPPWPWGHAYAWYQAGTIFAGAVWYYFQMMRSGVDRPDASTGQTVAVYDHGHRIYVEPWQTALHSISIFGSVAVGVAIIFWAQGRFSRESLGRFHPLPFALALSGAVLFWLFAPEAARRLAGGV